MKWQEEADLAISFKIFLFVGHGDFGGIVSWNGAYKETHIHDIHSLIWRGPCLRKKPFWLHRTSQSIVSCIVSSGVYRELYRIVACCIVPPLLIRSHYCMLKGPYPDSLDGRRPNFFFITHIFMLIIFRGIIIFLITLIFSRFYTREYYLPEFTYRGTLFAVHFQRCLILGAWKRATLRS